MAAAPKIGRGKKAAGIVLLLAALLLGASIYVISQYKVENITVEGNYHYSSDEIIEMVLTDRLSYNSIYLSLKYRNREIKNIPFIQTMSVRVLSKDTVVISVYEKTVAGYVEYMGRFLYFDRDGIVVESSETRTAGIPQVTGVSFDHVVLYEALPVEDPTIFRQILSITQLLSKYEIVTDKIYFNEANEITLYFDQVRVRLGNSGLEEKIMRLSAILPELEGESGVLQMENYTEEKSQVTFERD
ncbi:MAG: cell division protein FtsQ/DivIB [Lachnospiraceae bacterium]|nr:cell division protein FtsQ/DivIB [Lachnospiraceae bacterium]